MPLTDMECRMARAEGKSEKLFDGGGLHLLVHVNGSRYWRFDYRWQDRRRTLSLGKYPETGLKEARELRDEAKRNLAQNKDPSRIKKEKQRQAREDTFDRISDDYLAHLVSQKRSQTTLDKNIWLLKKLALPALRDRPVREIDAPELLELIKPIEKAGKLETANRLRSTLSRFFRYAIATQRCDRDPAADLRGAFAQPETKHHAGVTDERKLARLLEALSSYEGNASTRFALRLAPHVFLRPLELRRLEWPWVEWKKDQIRIPAEAMKKRREHIVPLTPCTRRILHEAYDENGHRKHVFYSASATTGYLSENTLTAALRYLGYSGNEQTVHGFRTTASTILNEQGWNSDWIERQLAHVESNKIRGAYNAALYIEGRRRMMNHWSDYLDTLDLLG